MPKGDAAQAVQASAFPELYAQREGEAHAIVGALKTNAKLQSCPSDAGIRAKLTLPANLTQLRRNLIHYAEQGVGGSYIWGGTAFKEWDCSGYVQWVYKQARIQLPRTEQSGRFRATLWCRIQTGPATGATWGSTLAAA